MVGLIEDGKNPGRGLVLQEVSAARRGQGHALRLYLTRSAEPFGPWELPSPKIPKLSTASAKSEDCGVDRPVSSHCLRKLQDGKGD